MPLYEYECAYCAEDPDGPKVVRLEEVRDVVARDDDCFCPECGCNMPRRPSLPQSYIGSTDRPTRGQG